MSNRRFEERTVARAHLARRFVTEELAAGDEQQRGRPLEHEEVVRVDRPGTALRIAHRPRVTREELTADRREPVAEVLSEDPFVHVELDVVELGLERLAL